jgi:hypothetical protein
MAGIMLRKILIISDISYRPSKLFLVRKPILAKGLIQLGHDVRCLSYGGILSQLSPFSSRYLSALLYKKKVDEIVGEYAKHYQPDVVLIGFPKFLDESTIRLLREKVPSAVYVGSDEDLWPSRNPGRIEAARELDIVLATNNGSSLDEYRQAGVKKCLFMPNVCDPDVEYRYEVGPEWQSDILWTGKVQHKGGLHLPDQIRQEVLSLLQNDERARIYGCLGHPTVQALDYYYAISGARIGVSINADNSVPLYHSDRFTHYTACGTMVLAKRVPDTERLMEDKKHVVYFDTASECMELINWYLGHEDERKKIADAGMQRCHTYFNPTRIAGYILELVERGRYEAPWGVFE